MMTFTKLSNMMQFLFLTFFLSTAVVTAVDPITVASSIIQTLPEAVPFSSEREIRLHVKFSLDVNQDVWCRIGSQSTNHKFSFVVPTSQIDCAFSNTQLEIGHHPLEISIDRGATWWPTERRIRLYNDPVVTSMSPAVIYERGKFLLEFKGTHVHLKLPNRAHAF